ncbi:hypothetical protein [Legionella spiritensis]|uniref:hypothetical protein n=1 Tax=Legionella spiritensis TaxID=452 RepID=UPI000F704DB4|nr:hypothetical protein [Legionella spiritensis]VEG91675.1 Fe-S protein [Legionella spiritensis]
MLVRILVFWGFINVVFAGPWMTGPLLAPSGKTIPPGDINIEPYAFYTEYPQGFKNFEVVPIVSFGISNFLDIQMSLPYDYSWVNGAHGSGIGDYSLALGVQLLRQGDNNSWPDVRLMFQEIFPTGRFERLSDAKMGTDQTGSGANTTLVSLNFQRLTSLPRDHYLRTRLSLAAATSSKVHVVGRNTFGGTRDTSGVVDPGNNYAIDLAFEYALTQHWVPVFEVLYTKSTASNFDGNPGFTPGGTVASIGGSGGEQTSLAPALEYNFSANLGVIVGVWFSVKGPQAAKFTTGTIAVNYFI